jgi:hypothetical protein
VKRREPRGLMLVLLESRTTFLVLGAWQPAPASLLSLDQESRPRSAELWAVKDPGPVDVQYNWRGAIS